MAPKTRRRIRIALGLGVCLALAMASSAYSGGRSPRSRRLMPGTIARLEMVPEFSDRPSTYVSASPKMEGGMVAQGVCGALVRVEADFGWPEPERLLVCETDMYGSYPAIYTDGSYDRRDVRVTMLDGKDAGKSGWVVRYVVVPSSRTSPGLTPPPRTPSAAIADRPAPETRRR
ncbi:MAG: hypothetical protein JWN86_4017 [Planctomycetota bacterium]|nr:hypothetical protein [Planctomycetota bacterium]